MRIGIIGGGVVGSATASVFRPYNEVLISDVDPIRNTHAIEDVCACEVVFICLPSPQKKDSLECDLSAIESLCSRVLDVPGRRGANYVLRSTVPIGTTRHLREKHGLKNLVHSPEFLTARTAEHDATHPTQLLIGCPNPVTQSSHPVHALYKARFYGIPIEMMGSDESEAIKLFTNAFFAVKVAFFNEINLLASKLNLDWQTVVKGMVRDGRVGAEHTRVPGPDGKYGFGGACLPKDLGFLIQHLLATWTSGSNKVVAPLVTAGAHQRNLLDRKRES